MADRGITPKGLEFKTLREVLDEAVPADVAPVGVGFPLPEGQYTECMPQGSDFDMAILKGIIAGVLAGCSARRIAFASTEDMGDDLADRDFEDDQKTLNADLRAHEQIDAWSALGLPQHVTAIYYGLIKSDEGATIDLSTDTYNFEVYVKTFVLPPNDYDLRMIVTVHLACDGGPPTDFYFVGND